MAIDFRKATPLYQQIADDIKEKIASGALGVGDQIAPQHELAQQYGVSLITVKKALADLIGEGILYSRVGKGTYVARKSAPINLSRHRAVGLVLKDLHSPFFSMVVQGVEAHAYRAGYNLLISNSSGDIEKEEGQIQHFREIGVDGLIIASMSREYRATDTIRQLHEEGFPYVMVSYMHDPDIYYVGADHELGGFLATEHLIKLGYRRIGYINAKEGNLLGEVRRQGYRRALEQYDRPVQEAFTFRLPLKGEWNDFQSGYDVGRRFLKRTERPDAVFVYNDLAALGFQQAVLDKGLRVPDDVAIVGFDDIERSAYAPVPLTTVRQPTAEIGASAMDLIIKQSHKERTATRMLLKPVLVVRASCGATTRVMQDMLSA